MPGLLVAAAALLTTALYWGGLNGPFLLDDFTNTTVIRLSTLNWQSLLDVAFSNDSGFLGRPVATLSFALNDYFGGMNGFNYKLTNLILHLATGLALFALSGRLLSIPLGPERKLAVRLIAAGATALWLLHPLQVSTVLYVVQRMAQLSALFTVLALLAYVIGRQRLLAGRHGGIAIMVTGTTAFGLLALFGKENGALIPLYLLVIEFLFFRFCAPDLKHQKTLLAFLGAFIVLPVVAGGIYLVVHFNGLAVYDARPFTLPQRMMTEVHALWFYLRLILLPRMGAMGLYHDDFPLTTTLDLATVLATAALASLLAAALILRHRALIFSFAVLWFLVSHALESTVLPLELVFEHRNYLAIYGPVLALTYYVGYSGSALLKSTYLRIGIVAAFAGLLSTITILRVDTWSTRDKFASTTVLYHPNSTRAQIELAQLYWSVGDQINSMAHVQRAAELTPWDPAIPAMMVWITCRDPERNPVYVRETKEKIRSATLPGFLAAVLLVIQKQLLENECPALPRTTFLELVDTVLSNKKLTDATGPYIVHLVRARVLISVGRFTDAMDAYETAYYADPRGLIPLFEKAYLQLNLGMLDATADTVSELRKADRGRLRYQRHKIEELETFLTQARKEK